MPSTSSNTSAQIKAPRVNDSYTYFFFEDDKADNTIRYCKICIKELEGSQLSPYLYTKSRSSTGNLTQHLRDKYKILAKNYKHHLDSQKQVSSLILNYLFKYYIL